MNNGQQGIYHRPSGGTSLAGVYQNKRDILLDLANKRLHFLDMILIEENQIVNLYQIDRQGNLNFLYSMTTKKEGAPGQKAVFDYWSDLSQLTGDTGPRHTFNLKCCARNDDGTIQEYIIPDKTFAYSYFNANIDNCPSRAEVSAERALPSTDQVVIVSNHPQTGYIIVDRDDGGETDSYQGLYYFPYPGDGQVTLCGNGICITPDSPKLLYRSVDGDLYPFFSGSGGHAMIYYYMGQDYFYSLNPIWDNVYQPYCGFGTIIRSTKDSEGTILAQQGYLARVVGGGSGTSQPHFNDNSRFYYRTYLNEDNEYYTFGSFVTQSYQGSATNVVDGSSLRLFDTYGRNAEHELIREAAGIFYYRTSPSNALLSMLNHSLSITMENGFYVLSGI